MHSEYTEIRVYSIYVDPSVKMVCQMALQNFANGYVGPMEKEDLSFSPLLNEFIDSNISQSVKMKGKMDVLKSPWKKCSFPPDTITVRKIQL